MAQGSSKPTVTEESAADILTALQLIDDAVAAEGAALAKGILIQGDDGTDRHNVQVNAGGEIKVTLNADSNLISVGGTVGHGAADIGNPLGSGGKGINHGMNPTEVDANDRTVLYANRAGIPWVIGGHPNILTLRANYAAAQTNTAIVSVGVGIRIIVTRCSVLVDRACTVDVQARIGFAAATTPTTTGVVLTHPGIGPGSGVIEGNGSGMLGVGATGEDLRITSGATTGGSIDVCVTYFTIDES